MSSWWQIKGTLACGYNDQTSLCEELGMRMSWHIMHQLFVLQQSDIRDSKPRLSISNVSCVISQPFLSNSAYTYLAPVETLWTLSFAMKSFVGSDKQISGMSRASAWVLLLSVSYLIDFLWRCTRRSRFNRQKYACCEASSPPCVTYFILLLFCTSPLLKKKTSVDKGSVLFRLEALH